VRMTLKTLTVVIGLALVAAGAANGQTDAAKSSGGIVPDIVATQIEKLSSNDPAARQVAFQALASLGPQAAPAVEPLIGFFGKPEADSAAKALVAIGAPAVEPLIAKLKDADEHLRVWAATLLGKIGDPRAKEPLLALLADRGMYVRYGAAKALGGLADKGVA